MLKDREPIPLPFDSAVLRQGLGEISSTALEVYKETKKVSVFEGIKYFEIIEIENRKFGLSNNNETLISSLYIKTEGNFVKIQMVVDTVAESGLVKSQFVADIHRSLDGDKEVEEQTQLTIDRFSRLENYEFIEYTKKTLIVRSLETDDTGNLQNAVSTVSKELSEILEALNENNFSTAVVRSRQDGDMVKKLQIMLN